MIQTANINAVWASLLMEKLVRCGLTRVVLSPGSRNTPLTVAAARNEAIATTVHFDERAAAFYALGLARALRKPVTLVCTSGSAVANYLPAVVEAAMDGVPLLLLTADRPPELHDCGANQTIPQIGLFGHFVRRQLDLTCPDPEIPAREFLQQLDHALIHLFGPDRGPVHINCPFREPLAPDKDSVDYAAYLNGIEPALEEPPLPGALPDQIPQHLMDHIRSVTRGMIVAGKLDSDQEQLAVLRIAERLGWPVLADIQSGLRVGGGHDSVVYHADQGLLSRRIGEDLRPDLVLHVGGRILSKRVLDWLAASSPEHYVRLASSKLPFDPNHQVTLTLVTDVAAACDKLSVTDREAGASEWLDNWRQLDAAVGDGLEQEIFGDDKTTSDPKIVAHVLKSLVALPDPPVLWSASSLPIRLLDMYAPGSGSPLTMLANRGASGIDGTIASAAGYADGSDRPVVLLIGDLALLHDLTSLHLVKHSKTPITIVLLNNNGGNIFGLLPIAAHADLFSDYFLTPHGHTFEHAARQFGIAYHRCDSMKPFDHLMADSINRSESSLIEVTIAPGAGTAHMREIATAIRTVVDSMEFPP